METKLWKSNKNHYLCAMTVTLLEFRRQAEQHGICEMVKEWDACMSNKQRIDLALSARGMEYIAKAIAEGWGISPDQICMEFKPFLNGRYVRNKDGYTSVLYCSDGKENCVAEINATTTALLAVDFIGTINIPKNRICEMHLVNCKCYIKGDGKGNVYAYGDTEIYNEQDAPIKVKRI